MSTQNVFLVEHHVVDWEPSTMVGLYGTWEAMLYGVNVEYPATHRHYKTFQTFTVTLTDEDGTPVVWTTPHSTRGYLRVSLEAVQTRTQDAFEVRIKTTRNGITGDGIARASNKITDRAHADALAADWNRTANIDPASTYYVHKVTA